MKKFNPFYFIIIVSIVFPIFLFGGESESIPTNIKDLLKVKPVKVERVLDDLKIEGLMYAPMSFGSHKFLLPSQLKELRGKIIYEIALVYTDYQQVKSFSQPKLNHKRLEKFYKIVPQVKDGPMINWLFVAQTACKNEVEAKKMFHGFIIKYRPEVTEEKTKDEIEKLSELANCIEKTVDSSYTYVKQKIRTRKKHVGYTPRLAFKRKKEKVYHKKSIWNRKSKSIRTKDTTFINKTMHTYSYKYLGDSACTPIYFNTYPESTKSLSSIISPFGPYVHKPNFERDSVVFKVLERNDWHNMLVVCDVTGSMSPYLKQVLIWTTLNFDNDRVNSYTFFNDGDNIPPHQKKTGKTGGIYSFRPISPEKMHENMFEVMRKGSGGDAQENDIEAILKATKEMKEAKEIVLIADNYAPLRDYSLIKEVNKPVKVILCGAHRKINPQYIDLARLTGGSVHTMEEDITNLASYRVGEEIVIAGKTYVVTKRGVR